MEEQQVKPAAEDFRAIVEQHLREMDEERESDLGPFRLIKDGTVEIVEEKDARAVAKLIVEAEEELARVEDLAEQRIARAKSKVTRLEYLFLAALERWTQAKLSGKKERSIIFDEAKLQLRKQPKKVVTESDATLTAWAERFLIDAISYPPKVSLDAVKAWEKKEGKLAPGRIETPEGEKLYVYGKKKED